MISPMVDVLFQLQFPFLNVASLNASYRIPDKLFLLCGSPISILFIVHPMNAPRFIYFTLPKYMRLKVQDVNAYYGTSTKESKWKSWLKRMFWKAFFLHYLDVSEVSIHLGVNYTIKCFIANRVDGRSENVNSVKWTAIFKQLSRDVIDMWDHKIYILEAETSFEYAVTKL